MPYQSVGDFPVDVMMNRFNLSNWNYNDSDLYESIDLIKDYYDILTGRLRRQILDASLLDISSHSGKRSYLPWEKEFPCRYIPSTLADTS